MIIQPVVYKIMLTSEITKKIIAIDLSKQQVLDSDLRATRQINFTANLDHANNTRIFFILEEAKKLFWTFQKEL